MHCIFEAYQQHLAYLGIYDVFTESTCEAWVYYVRTKSLTHDGKTDCPTYGAVVPLMMDNLAWFYGLEVEIEHRIFGSRDYYEGDEECQLTMLTACSLGDFGQLVEKITLEPAIYLLLADGHATFSETVPTSGVPVMALQLSYKES